MQPTSSPDLLKKIEIYGLGELNGQEFALLVEFQKQRKITFDQIQQMDNKNEVHKKRREMIVIAVTVVAVTGAIFVLAYFAAPAIAIKLTYWLATAPARAKPAVVAAAKAALAAGTYMGLGTAHHMLSVAYASLLLMPLLSFGFKREQLALKWNELYKVNSSLSN